MSALQFGLPLKVSSVQTILPVVMPSGKIYGFFPITSKAFNGTERTYALSQGSVPITTVTLPPRVGDRSGYSARNQYVAAVWPIEVESQRPWLGYEELVDTNHTGYYSWWSMPVTSWFHHFGRGMLIDSLLTRMNKYPAPASGGDLPDPDPLEGVLRWATAMNMQAFTEDCAFFDFNWVDLFEVPMVEDPTQQGNAVAPVSIRTISNPEFFKASVVQGMGGQTILPGGGVMYNTVRILRLEDPTVGDYVFEFEIDTNAGAVVPATLTLTVV